MLRPAAMRVRLPPQAPYLQVNMGSNSNSNSNNKKKDQLGMSYGKASHTLVKDLLFSFLSRENGLCFRCGLPLDRKSFSIDHITPWLDSDAPVDLFFDIGNISFSHLSCNVRAARRVNKAYFTDEERKEANRRLNKESWNRKSDDEKRKRRRNNYLKYNC